MIIHNRRRRDGQSKTGSKGVIAISLLGVRLLLLCLAVCTFSEIRRIRDLV